MPRYFFHVRSGGDLTRDPDGAELPDIDAARKHAVKMACRAWSERPPESQENNETFEIADGSGEVVLRVPFSEAFAERAVT
ncbi:MAG TPA: hypothetical protein VEY05_11980 [Beijerinckiaceae bacterium]|jgi:hypothetical protein|nr:hypothetical protein [Beijerinckiaceae bacterium]